MILANAFCFFFFLGEYLRAARAVRPAEPGGGGPRGRRVRVPASSQGHWGRAGRRGDWLGNPRKSAPRSEPAWAQPAERGRAQARAVWLPGGVGKETY